jgi:ABC-type transporter MlaC component
MNLKSIIAILAVAGAPVCAQAQNPTPAKVTKADAQNVFKVISSNKAKIQAFCDIGKLAVAIGGKADMPFCTAYVR